MIAAAYIRKSNDQGDRSEDVKSVAVQRDLLTRFVEKQGWTLGPVFEDDGITGATFTGRPGLQKLLAALKPAPDFQILVVVEQSRIGRETLDTLITIRTIERAGVEVWSTRDGRRISMKKDSDSILAMIEGWRDTSERRKVAPRVRDAAHNRHERGYVVGGKTYGYRNVRAGEKQPVTRIVHEPEAVIVRRIFEATAQGHGLHRIAKALNAEGIPGPRNHWSPTGVREVLNRRDYIGDIITNRIQRAWDEENQRPIRIEQPESEWKIRKDESLRIVTDELWQAAHARIAQTNASYLKKGNRLVGKRESFHGLYLLSGLLACGETKADGSFCMSPLIVVTRGRQNTSQYICKAHHERGDAVCTNTSGVPADLIHPAVVQSLHKTFDADFFEQHLQQVATDDQARESRRAERENLLQQIPALAAAEARLAKAVARTDDAEALIAELKTHQQERRQAEARVTELEGIERDLRADADAVERLRETWKNWSGALSVDRGSQEIARQVLRKVLECPIIVRPTSTTRGDRSWAYAGIAGYDGVLSGGISPEAVVVTGHRETDKLGRLRALLRALGVQPTISGGSDAPDGEGVGRTGHVWAPHLLGPGYFRWSQGPSGIHLARFVVNSSGHTVTREPFCHWSM